jgi:ATP/maltotriose-dependent transcriptional regulator MalT
VSPNTVKTHVARVYQKLDVQRRMTAVERARALAIIA